jgi:hypothetical protein
MGHTTVHTLAHITTLKKIKNRSISKNYCQQFKGDSITF